MAATASTLQAERDARQIREEIERTRALLAAEVSTLSREVAQRADWRAWVSERPLLFLGGAFAFGFWMADR